MLNDIYYDNLKMSDIEKKSCRNILKQFLRQFIGEMRNTEAFNQVYESTYLGGSFYEDLKLATSIYEFDLNICMVGDSNSIVFGLGEEKKPNFGYIGFLDHTLSPVKLCKLLLSTVDQAISSFRGQLEIKQKTYKVKR